MKTISRVESIYKLLDGANTGRIFFVEFRKKDGTLRRMTARKGVTKGVTGKGMNYRPLGKGYVTVFDMDKGEFRMVNLNTVRRFSVNGEKYLVI
jgi:hypothetical protein